MSTENLIKLNDLLTKGSNTLLTDLHQAYNNYVSYIHEQLTDELLDGLSPTVVQAIIEENKTHVQTGVDKLIAEINNNAK